MNKEEKIIAYMKDHGLNIKNYICTYDYYRPGTVVLASQRIWGYGGHYDDWIRLHEILQDPACPVELHRIRDMQGGRFNYLLRYDRLTWNSRKEVKA